MKEKDIKHLLERIVEALERLSPPKRNNCNIESADTYVWHPDEAWLEPISTVNRVDFSLLKGIDHQKSLLLNNSINFANGLPSNNALLWGAKGTGKSSLIKSSHAEVNKQVSSALALIEIQREDILSLPELLTILRPSNRRFILYCDDLSFDKTDGSFKSLKVVLDGGVEGRPENVIFYATSNLRHLIPRDAIENERLSTINPGEIGEEKISLSDRFGLWLGFHKCDQKTYFDIINGYVDYYGINIQKDTLERQANEWAVTRGSRSGRTAWQFIQHLAGQLNQKI